MRNGRNTPSSPLPGVPVSRAGAPPRGDAVVWDFDGTLVNSHVKNLAVTRAIVERVTQRPAGAFESLSSLDSYLTALASMRNWRDLYGRVFGLSEPDVDRAGRLWVEYQLGDSTPTPLIEGIPAVLRSLRHLPHGIVSQNARAAIAAVLEGARVAEYFGAVIGFEEVDLRRQKPAPDGLLRCVEILTELRPGCVFYVGDHETDAMCAAHAREELAARKLRVEVISIGALYDGESAAAWAVRPDHTVRRPEEIVEIVARRTAGRLPSGS
jgi:phosphoglycolate phosphatase-like HAD superfamily hydrolase